MPSLRRFAGVAVPVAPGDTLSRSPLVRSLSVAPVAVPVVPSDMAAPSPAVAVRNERRFIMNFSFRRIYQNSRVWQSLSSSSRFEYELRIQVTKAGKPDAWSGVGYPEDELGSLVQEVVVPPGDQGLDLGLLKVAIREE